MLMIGGGDEPKGPTTKFDESFQTTGIALLKAGWDINTLFNGGHSTSEQISEKTFGRKNTPFTQEKLNIELDRIKKLILEKKLKTGDQFLLIIDTHGAPKSPKEDFHKIATSNGTISTGQFKQIRDLLTNNGIKVGIIDGSCYGGASQELSNDKTCVITFSSYKTPSYFSSQKNYISEMISGHNLEQIFLSGRMKDTVPAYAEISTAPGKLTTKILESFVNMIQGGYEFEKRACDSNNQLSPLNKQFLSDLSKIITSFGGNKKDLEDLVCFFENYNKLIAEATTLNTNINSDSNYNKNESITINSDNMVSSASYSWKNLAQYDVTEMKEYLAEKLKTPSLDPASRNWIATEVKMLPAIQKKQNELEKSNPHFRDLKSKTIALKKLQEDIFAKAKKIIETERLIYQKNYLLHNSNQKNPCKDFAI